MRCRGRWRGWRVARARQPDGSWSAAQRPHPSPRTPGPAAPPPPSGLCAPPVCKRLIAVGTWCGGARLDSAELRGAHAAAYRRGQRHGQQQRCEREPGNAARHDDLPCDAPSVRRLSPDDGRLRAPLGDLTAEPVGERAAQQLRSHIAVQEGRLDDALRINQVSVHPGCQ